MTPLDSQLFLAINHGLNNSFNDLWLGYATWLGNGWIGFPIAILFLLALDRKFFWRNLLVLAVAASIGGIALNLIKQAVHAPRPLTVFAQDIAAGRVYINVMFDRLYWNSFPSGHTQTAFTIVTVLIWAGRKSSKLKWWGIVALVSVGVTIGISRLYCGAHFPSDVLAGAVLGSTSAYLCCYSIGHWRTKRLSLNAARSTDDSSGTVPALVPAREDI